MTNGSAGRWLYEAWCGSGGSDRARYFDLMNPADRREWERLGAVLVEARLLLDGVLSGDGKSLRRGELADVEVARGLVASLAGGSLVPGEVAALRNVERAAREVDVLFGGSPERWTVDGVPVTDDASGALLDLHDYLSDVDRVRR